MNRYSCAATVLLALTPLAAAADLSDAARCAGIDDDAERLACYDLAVGRTVSADAVDAAADVIDERSPEPRPEPASASGAAADFGAEQVKEQPIDRIEARLIGDFTGWNGRTVFRLDNGQVWQQTRNYIPDYKARDPMPQPKVTITKGWFGTYNLKVEGVKRIVQVKRIE